MTPAEIYAELKRIAPSISFEATYTPDPNFQWDGDGHDPEDDGYIAVDVNVEATAIVNGEKLEGHNYLGGHYIKPGEDLGDISGYLPQMLEEAARELYGQMPTTGDTTLAKTQLRAVFTFLKDETRHRYDTQRRTIDTNK